jgi:hypothetical protein
MHRKFVKIMMLSIQLPENLNLNLIIRMNTNIMHLSFLKSFIGSKNS